MRTLTKTITIRAPASKVWEVLTSPRLIPEWADSFTPGATAESEWLPGSEVVWTGDNGMVMRGQVTESVPDQTLRMTFPAGQAPDQDFDQVESFTLEPQGDTTLLTATHGPFGAQGYEMMEPPWDAAMAAIKSLAEGDASGRHLRDANSADISPPA